MGCGCKKRKVSSQPKKTSKLKSKNTSDTAKTRIIKRVRRVTK